MEKEVKFYSRDTFDTYEEQIDQLTLLDDYHEDMRSLHEVF